MNAPGLPASRSRPDVGGWLLVLILLLTVWNPASLALHAASTVANLSSRPTLSLVFLGARLLITGVGVAAGIALWLRRPGAVWLAKAVLVLFAVEAIARLSMRVDLATAPPGTRLPIAIVVIVHNAAWYLYLQRSRRVSATYGLESHL